MITLKSLFLLLISLLLINSQKSVPLAAGTPEFSVTVVTDVVNVVCMATVSVTCQAVQIGSNGQTLLGIAQTIDSVRVGFIDVEILTINTQTILVCYSTVNMGGYCSLIPIDVNFGLLSSTQSDSLSFCTEDEECDNISLSLIDEEGVAICYSTNQGGSCSMIKTNVGGLPTASRESHFEQEFWMSTSLFSIPNSNVLVLCTTQGHEEQEGKCRQLYVETLLEISTSTPHSLGSVSILSGASLGKIAGIPFVLICYLQSESGNLYCSSLRFLNNQFFPSSTGVFGTPYNGLLGLRVQPLSTKVITSVSSSLVCIATVELGSSELVCSLVKVDTNGVVSIDAREFVVNQDGFLLQNATQARATENSAGAYLEKSSLVGTRDISSAEEGDGPLPYLSDVIILPNFANAYQSVNSLISSVGCVNVGFHDLDNARYCVGVSNPLTRPAAPRPAFPSDSFCTNVKKPWECAARSEFCVMVGLKCYSKHGCYSQTTESSCNTMKNAGGQCQWDGKYCIATFDWDSKTMCQTITKSNWCTSSSGCVWILKSCKPAPYCQGLNKKTCPTSPGCVWLANQCGIAA